MKFTNSFEANSKLPLGPNLFVGVRGSILEIVSYHPEMASFHGIWLSRSAFGEKHDTDIGKREGYVIVSKGD